MAKETADYLWDRESGLPLLLDDGSDAYLHKGGVLASIDGADDPSYLLADGLGTVRGVTDDAGSLVGTSDYNVFGEVRASSGVSTLFRFTGEQFDAGTGFTFLRARYLNPALGRFISADTVQPNAPGTQGWNLYAYAANNPTTWIDPSGHAVAVAARSGVGAASGISLAALFMEWATNPMTWGVITACAVSIEGCGLAFGAAAAMTAQENRFGVLPWAQLGMLGLVCAISSTFDHIPGKGIEWSGCLGLALKISAVVGEYASTAIEGAWEWWNGPDPKEVFEKLKNAAKEWPKIITATIVIVSGRPCGTAGLFLPLEPRLTDHVMPRHKKSSPHMNPSTGIPTGKFWTDNQTLIAIAIRGAGLFGWATGLWKPDAGYCRAHVPTGFFEIGLDDHPKLNGQPSHCLRIVALWYLPHRLHTAYPVKDSWCN